ncbi:NADP(H)-dependent aldo-keto reductase [Magnetospira sp. QH-2]|uniref:NADP(H)-dependent aldo-keto reductase n=1 Tax=Magnetospira sp. (strain QH-2) TaxID=1288970 RepID=UPI0003E80ECD|nr:NADP(H)-dependent aldo-keto reductase [Magnetospira sp. QH-2]CCQ75550.1 oxidoreductase, NADP(H)-dependent aldo-keto reductase [Magnetospira sp. QH-2]
MQYTQLGRTGLEVSRICLGTMTWGEQNTEADAHAQLDMALDRGINFIDTAEMYPVAPRAATQGRTERYIGSWLKARGNRDRVIIASKVAAPSDFSKHIRPNMKFDRANITAAVDASLKRLNTDVIDLYQLHWPERETNFFGQLGYVHKEGQDFTPFAEVLQALDEQIQAGKIRYLGLSNETAWGLMKYLNLAESLGLPRMQSIQNPYSLLNRSFEVGLAEAAIREDCGLLAYSPLGFGVLSGKYLNGARPAGARCTIWERFGRYLNDRAQQATAAYVALARDHGLDPAQMALAYVTDRPFVTSTIIGATSTTQLATDMDSIDVTLSDEVLAAIEAIHDANPYPAP